MFTDKIPPQFSKAFETITVDLPGGFVAQPSYLSAAAIVFLIFLLILTLGQLRRRLVDWSFKGLFPGIALGFMLALILEGFLLVHGSTAVTSVLGWKSAPQPITKALDSGKEKLTEVLGETTLEVGNNQSTLPSAQDALDIYEGLTEDKKSQVKAYVCRQ